MKNREFTLVELLIVVAIIAVLASLLLPALSTVKAKTRALKCSSNQKQTGMALNMYSNDFNDFTCPKLTADGSYAWSKILIDNDFVKECQPELIFTNSILTCPDGRNNSHKSTRYYGTSFGVNVCVSSSFTTSRWFKRSQVGNSSTVIQATDAMTYWMGFYAGGCGFDYVLNRHLGKTNILFFDGHVNSMNKELIPNGTGISANDFYRWWGPDKSGW